MVYLLKMGGFSMAMLNKQRVFIMALQWVWQCTYHGDIQRCLSEGGIEAAMRFLSSNSIKYTNPKWGIQWDVYLATIILELECLGFAWKMMSINLINGWIYGTCCGKPWFVPPILPVSCGFSTLCGMALKNPSQKHAHHGGTSSKSKYCGE